MSGDVTVQLSVLTDPDTDAASRLEARNGLFGLTARTMRRAFR